MQWVSRAKVELRDLLELVLVPGLAAVLPWGVCFSVFKRAARWKWLYREATEGALAEARLRGWGGADEQHWLWVRKLVTLVDHADHYLGLTRTDRWLRRHVIVHGAWSQGSGAALLATFHWGAGYWGLRHAAAHGLRPHALVASLEAPAFAGRTVMTHYARARNRNVQKTLGAALIDTKRGLRTLVSAVRKQEPLLAVLDVPVDDHATAFSTRILGMEALFAQGVLRLAVEHGLATTLYITGLDVNTGRRTLVIEPAITPTNIQALGEHAFGYVDKLILSDAPAWHFWGIAPRIFKSPTGAQ